MYLKFIENRLEFQFATSVLDPYSLNPDPDPDAEKSLKPNPDPRGFLTLPVPVPRIELI